MKKIILMLTFAGGMHFSSFAQPNATEAKAAYMLAEESYNKADYKTALEYLQQAKSALGTNSSKVLYLQILVTKAMHAKNPNVSELLLPLINEFEQASDYKTLNEDKVLEITKIKLTMRLEQKALNEKAEKEKAIKDAENRMNLAMDKIFKKYPALNLTAEQFYEAYPELNAKKWRQSKRYATVLGPSFVDYDFYKEDYPFGELDKDVDFKNQVVSMQYQPSGGVQKTYSFVGILVYTDKNINPDGATAAMADINEILDNYRSELGAPTIARDEDSNVLKGAHYTVYRWQTKDRRVDVCKLYYPKGDKPVVKLFEEVRRIP